MQDPKVLFLLCGGTINQVLHHREDGQSYCVAPEDSVEFEKACEPVLSEYEEDFEIDFELLTTKDSSNMHPGDWESLIERVKRAQNKEGYCGVVIAHGTDTMAFTGAALSFGLHGSNPNGSNLRIPVCLTGSQKTIYAIGTDAFNNLRLAFETIKKSMEMRVADITLAFHEEVMLGTRIVKVSEREFRAFASPNYPPVGVLNGGKLFLNPSLLNSIDRHLESSTDMNRFKTGMVCFELMPGVDPTLILDAVDTGKVTSVLLRCYGEGYMCTEGDYNLIPVIETLTEKKIPVFLTSQIVAAVASANHYEVGVKAVDAGAIACFDQSVPIVSVKVAWLTANELCHSIADFREAMHTNYVGELTPYVDTIG